MSKIHVEEQTNGELTVTLTGVTRLPFAYRRPRCPVKHIRRLVRRSRRIARIGVQVVISSSFISAGIMMGLNPIGAMLFVVGICLASCQEDKQTKEEYRQAVITHFSERGKTPPRWTRR